MKSAMSREILTCLFATCFALVPLPAKAQADAPASATHPGFADLSARLLPTVVNISTTQKIEKDTSAEAVPDMPQFPPGSPFEDFFEEFLNRRGGEAMPNVPATSLGSGFVIDAAKGYIATNNHVIKDADEVRVTLHDDTTLDAEVIGRDEKMDLAVLRVKTDHKLTAVSFGDSDVLRVGDWVLAIGNPFGLGGTVTAGIVSAQQRNINAGPYDDFIQTDASINRGNSGGPMFNDRGDIIGINTAIFSPSGGSVGIGFAIPINLAKPVLNQLIEYGRTRRGWVGVRIQQVTPEIAENLGLDRARGALVASVTEGGPAEKAGLAAGDIILEFNGKPINEMRNLPRVVAETNIGQKSKLTFWREGKEKTATVEVGELEKAEDTGLLSKEDKSDSAVSVKGEKIDSVGLTLRSITAQDRADRQISDDIKGAIVDSVENNSEAAQKGILPGDIIVEIAQLPVTDAAAAAEAINKAEKDKKSSVLLLIHRNQDVRFVALRLGKHKK